MLINVAIKAGTIDLLAAWTGANIPTWALPIAFTAIAAIMSFFSSTLGVVCPALFPIVPQIAAATGIDPVVLFACIVIGGQSSAISPFSICPPSKPNRFLGLTLISSTSRSKEITFFFTSSV